MKWITLVLLGVSAVHGKVYERCELARELVEKHEAPMNQVATWVCIAEHESQYNTSAVGEKNGDNSKDHGIFQISDLFWCSPPGKGWACGVTCAQLEDDNIEDDYICARRIYREHKLLSGNGFNAWVVYHTHCSGPVDSYIRGCFDENPPQSLQDETVLLSVPVSTLFSPPDETSSTPLVSQSSSLPSETTSALLISPVPSFFSISSTTEVPQSNSISSRFSQQRPAFQWFSSLGWS